MQFMDILSPEKLQEVINRKKEIEKLLEDAVSAHMEEEKQGNHSSDTCPIASNSIIIKHFPFISEIDAQIVQAICLTSFVRRFFQGSKVTTLEAYELMKELEVVIKQVIWLTSLVNEQPKEKADA